MITPGGMATGGSVTIDVGAARLHWFPDQAGTSARRRLRTPFLQYQVQARKGSALQVLMIEDDASIAEMYRLQLEHDGYRVTVATTEISGHIPVWVESGRRGPQES